MRSRKLYPVELALANFDLLIVKVQLIPTDHPILVNLQCLCFMKKTACPITGNRLRPIRMNQSFPTTR
jgi:hypothetical protein